MSNAVGSLGSGMTLICRPADRLLQGGAANQEPEMKCEITFENYKSMTLVGHSLLERHAAGRAFKMFLDLASAPETYNVMVESKPVSVAGAVLVWGAVTPEGRDDVLGHTAIEDVLSVEEASNELITTRNPEYLALVEERHRWCGELFRYLATPTCSGVERRD